MSSAATSQQKDVKIGLLLLPDELVRNQLVLQALHIIKSVKGIDYRVNDLVRHEVYQHFASAPNEARLILLKFQFAAVDEIRQGIQQRFAKQQAGISAQQFVTTALLRHFNQLFQDLRPYYHQLKWYHKIRRGGSPRYQTVPCAFHPAKPRLCFEVSYGEEGLAIHTLVDTGEERRHLHEFVRQAFLLEKDHVYFVLAHKDCQVLEWLESPQQRAHAQDPAAFLEHVVARLELDYTVNRNGLFDEKRIEAVPSCRVLLSELNNSFLLLTPQWLYDGIPLDGQWKESAEVSINGARLRIARHRETEENFLQLLRALHPNFARQSNGYFYLSFADAQKKQWFIKSYFKLLDQNIEIAGMDLLQHFKYSPHRPDTSTSIVQEQGSFVRLKMSVSFGAETISLFQLQKTLHAGQRAVLLKDGSLGMLSDEWLRAYAPLVKHGSVKGTELTVSRFLALPDGEPSATPALGGLVQEEWWLKWKRWQTGNDTIYPVPAAVSATLRPYQQKGFEWLALLADIGAGGCLADDMGLGKTLQTICFLARQIAQFPTSRNLIVCPTSLVYNWQQELKKFAPSISVEVFGGAKGDRTTLPNTQVVITSYGMLRNHHAVLAGGDFGVAVLDESHHIKNPSAQVTRLVQELPAAIRIALSGTPVVNNTVDLYSQLQFALPGLLGTREFFKREYADPIDRYGDEVKIKSLQRLTSPFILRRTKGQVAQDLPAKSESVLWCTMGPRQKELYNEIKDSVRTTLLGDIEAHGLNRSKLAVLQGLLKLRQVCNAPQLLPADEQQGITESVKTEVLLDELSNLMGRHRVLVFSQFTSMLQLLAQAAAKKGLPYFLLDGQTPAEKRMQMVNAFQEEAGAPSLFFISLKAGNTGLTLTAADYVFLFDPWWNTAVEQQAIDRTYRIGQTKNVFAYKLICKDTIEERIVELQNRKKHLADELISEDEGFVKTLTEEDITYLLQ